MTTGPITTTINGGQAMAIVEGITREEEGEIGESEPFKGTWHEFTRLQEIRSEITERSGDKYDQFPYQLDLDAELIMNWEDSDINLIERATGIRID